jgi:hypothetical protein
MTNAMKVVCSTAKTLTTLKENRKAHREMVLDARKGFKVKAEALLIDALKQLNAGKLRSIRVVQDGPISHTKEYDTAISMLEMHTLATIELTAHDVTRFIEDEWSWSRDFVFSNSHYSEQIRTLQKTKYGHEDQGW